MKRLISVMLTLVLLFGLAGTGSAEGEESFGPALANWISSLNLDKYDLKGCLNLGPGTDLGMTLRQEDGVIEADLENLGRAQISPSRAAWEFTGQKVIVDIGSLANMVMNMTGGESQVQADAEMLTPWLEKALAQILMP